MISMIGLVGGDPDALDLKRFVLKLPLLADENDPG